MWSLGPLFKEHSRHRSVNAVKLRSSGSVIAKHLMRRSRRQELSMYTAVVLGWRETGSTSHVAGAGVGEASLRRCVRGALARPRHPRRAPAPLPRARRPRAPGPRPRASTPRRPRGGGQGKRQFSHLLSYNSCLSICNWFYCLFVKPQITKSVIFIVRDMSRRLRHWHRVYYIVLLIYF